MAAIKTFILAIVLVALAATAGLAQNPGPGPGVYVPPNSSVSGPFTSTGSVTAGTHVGSSQATFTAVAGCGVTPTLAGTDQNGSVTVGATPGTCVVTYKTPFIHTPAAVICQRNSAGTLTLVACTTTMTALTLNPAGSPALSSGDILTWIFLGTN